MFPSVPSKPFSHCVLIILVCELPLSMDFGGEPGFPAGSVGPTVPEIAGDGGGFDYWAAGMNDQAIWATEDEYRKWNVGPPGETLSNSNYTSGPPARSGIEPPNKKSRSSQSADSASSRSKAIGRMFFKTKLCCKFRAGVCPYITNCNFAHGIEELRRPPPNWQEIVAAHEEERGVSVEQREEHQIPTISSSDSRSESQRSYKGRHCKKFYTDEGCPYGDNCTFLHDEQSRARESVAISVSPTVGSGYGTSGVNQKPSNWKTRICNKWETTGNCPFGSKCHFAHGLAELHKYGGAVVETEGRDSLAQTESKQSGGGSENNRCSRSFCLVSSSGRVSPCWHGCSFTKAFCHEPASWAEAHSEMERARQD
ncbi:hypothetical protein Ancab_009552 [Ancistrocladus abbreviatus]